MDPDSSPPVMSVQRGVSTAEDETLAPPALVVVDIGEISRRVRSSCGVPADTTPCVLFSREARLLESACGGQLPVVATMTPAFSPGRLTARERRVVETPRRDGDRCLMRLPSPTFADGETARCVVPGEIGTAGMGVGIVGVQAGEVHDSWWRTGGCGV